MSLKEMWKYLLNKKWESDEVWMLILYVFIASIFTTPLLGIPLGLIAFLFFNEEVHKK
ncbi:VraH family peptide resistance protein [Staphylococcus simulans]|uniref:VraH family peptide resistance protein n=1 Tax=Staphylococcus simulans TaxID=1286 RepID=UPI00115B1845|nr:VraH family protein [Staphylococcus simulans]